MKFKPFFTAYDEITGPEVGPWHEVNSLKDILDIEYPGGLLKARGHLAQVHYKSKYSLQAAKKAGEYHGYTYVGYLWEQYDTGKLCIRGFIDELPAKKEVAIWNAEAGEWDIKEEA